MRIPFLILAPVCVFLGASSVIASGEPIHSTNFLLALLGGLLAHISVNSLNEYHDFQTGLDFNTQRTPFSGGSGALPDNPDSAILVLATGLITLLATFLVGVYFVWQYGFFIVPLGLVGLLLMVTYTGWINKHPFLCLIAPGLGFGLLMVLASHYVLQGEFSVLALWLALIPFFQVNNLLLLNQYPDIEADKKAGRYHFPIAFGVYRSSMVYGIFAISSIMLILLYSLMGIVTGWSLLAILPASLAFFALSGAVKYGENIGSHPQYLGANVAATVLTPLVLGLTVAFL